MVIGRFASVHRRGRSGLRADSPLKTCRYEPEPGCLLALGAAGHVVDC